jgi:putative hydrolase of the HAD superfamily
MHLAGAHRCVGAGAHWGDAELLASLDGTLVDHDGAAAAALHAWLQSYGLTAAAINILIPLWCDIEQRHYPAWSAGEITFQE